MYHKDNQICHVYIPEVKFLFYSSLNDNFRHINMKSNITLISHSIKYYIEKSQQGKENIYSGYGLFTIYLQIVLRI